MKNEKSKNKLIIIILGPPGSGKGTQAELLCKRFDLKFFGAGDSLRQRQKVNDFTGMKIKEVMEAGKWVPSFIISKFWIEKLEKFKQERRFSGLVSEGSPRRILEAQLFDEALNWYDWQKNLKVIFLNISPRESFNRLARRRQCTKCGQLIPWIDKFKMLKKCDKCGGRLIIRNDKKPKAIKSV